MAEHISKLCESLKSRNVRTETWQNEWRKKRDARGKVGAASGAIFVQPVAESEAADLASDQGIMGKYLDAAGFPDAKSCCGSPKPSAILTSPLTSPRPPQRLST